MYDAACSTRNHFLFQRDFMQKTIQLIVAVTCLVNCTRGLEQTITSHDHSIIETKKSKENSPPMSELNTLQLFSICFATLMADHKEFPYLIRFFWIYTANLGTSLFTSGKGVKTPGSYSDEGLSHLLPILGMKALAGDNILGDSRILHNFLIALGYATGTKLTEYFFKEKIKEKK